MSKEEIAQLYFDLSNKSDFIDIAKLMTPTTRYKSANTGEFEGVDAIIEMQKAFHGRFTVLNWKVNSISNVDKDTICFDYDFSGTQTDGKQITSSGLEYITVRDEKIVAIEIKNKEIE